MTYFTKHAQLVIRRRSLFEDWQQEYRVHCEYLQMLDLWVYYDAYEDKFSAFSDPADFPVSVDEKVIDWQVFDDLTGNSYEKDEIEHLI